jgi:mannose-6-phosphate isomerase-like protein (cupin superfamily)
VITDAKDYGLILGKNGKLYDTKRGQNLPDGVPPMPLLTEDELKAFPEPTTAEVIPNHVARYWDLMALSDRQPAKVIGEHGKLRDRPGFEVEFLSRGSIPESPYVLDRHEVLMPMRGYWRLSWGNGSTVLNPGDTAAIPPGLEHSLTPAVTGEASLYRVLNTDDPAGPTGRLL